MKQYLLLSSFLLAVSAAFGQTPNQATNTQTGNQQTSTQLQAGSSLTSIVTQTTGSSGSVNVGNISRTDQTGDGHSAIVDQIDAFSNTAGITQTGATNAAAIAQTDVSTSNTATIGQYGTNNGAGTGPQALGATSIFQGLIATGNSASITQGSVGSPVSGNSAQIQQYENAVNNVATIGQSSSANTGLITQATSASGNTAAVDQSVGSSYGEISQIGNATSNSATVTQSADGNRGLIFQQGAFEGSDASYQNIATVTQSAVNNEGTINQIGTDGDSHNNTATILQTGSGNNSSATVFGQPGGAIINQGTSTEGSGDSFFNVAGIVQSGTGNGALINQYDNSFYNSATIVQAGTSGYAEINQVTESGNNVVSITQGQQGTSNEAYVRQQNTDNSGASSATQNTVTLTQNTTRSGGFNTIRVVQGYGVDFAGPSTTLSTGNSVTGSQQGSNNDARLGQAGTTNRAVFTQTGSGNVLYNANPDGSPGNTFAPMIGTGNTLTVTQTNEFTTGQANSNAAYVNISGVNNTAVVNQTIVVTP